MNPPSVKKFAQELRDHLKGDLFFDPVTRRAYSVDASIYEVVPLGIVQPRDAHDLRTAIQIANEHQVPVIARGAATGITGACLGHGLIIDLSRYLNQILAINYDQELAVVEPGVIQDELNYALAARGYRLGPDTSTGNRSTIGGMLANNSAGARSLRYGKMVDHVHSVDLILANGRQIHLQTLSEGDWTAKEQLADQEGTIYRTIRQIKEHYGPEIQARFPHIPRRASGYNLDELLKPGAFNPAKLIAGSEGSLGIASQITMRIARKPVETGLCVIHFADMLHAFSTVPDLVKFKPLALEMIDHQIIAMGRLSPTMKTRLHWLQGDPQAVFVAEFDAETPALLQQHLKEFATYVKDKQIGYAHVILTDPKAMADIWAVRKAGLELLLSKRSYSRAIAFIEDISVGPDKLSPFMQQFITCLKRHGKEAGIYGHVGPGCMHIRPFIDLRQPQELEVMHQLMDEVSDLLLTFGGAFSGEHGDGLVRTWTNRKMFGDQLYQAFKELKDAFDPHHRMNPGKKVDGPEFLENLRLSPRTSIQTVQTFQDFSKEGGFALAADLCNGNGLCRKKESVMCPSFQATLNEYDTTRARAQALRAIVNGHVPLHELQGESLHDVLDLCLQCKGCKKECPSQVDMAKMKSEVLHHHQETHGTSLRTRLIGYMPDLYRIGSLWPRFSNWALQCAFSQWALSQIGFSPKRPLPLLAAKRFSSHASPSNMSQKSVVLFADTYAEFNAPNIGESAKQVLEALGYQVIIPAYTCCGRPFISKGMLKQAKRKAEHLIHMLLPYAQQGLVIVGLEPSCISAITDDYQGLLGYNHSELKQVASQFQSIEQFIHSHLMDGKLPLELDDHPLSVHFHGHCHQKSLGFSTYAFELLKALPGCSVHEIHSGCCGVAGSFGFEAEHYDLSVKIGELKLIPAVKNALQTDAIVANGISCRSQIEHLSTKHGMHVVELIAKRLNDKTTKRT
jgi:FAD/FMN-containing dehydrogenase/Fe-S oxidoreductase